MGGAGQRSDARSEARALLAAVTARAEADGFADVAARARRVEASLEENAGAAAVPATDVPPGGRALDDRLRGNARAGFATARACATWPRCSRAPARRCPSSLWRRGTPARRRPAKAGRIASAIEQRLEALRDEIEESARWNDLERGERARREREELATELAATLGLGGGDRRAGTPVARARYSVTKAIRNAVRRIAREHAVLGRHLETTVRTGLYCRYQPDPLLSPRWRVQP